MIHNHHHSITPAVTVAAATTWLLGFGLLVAGTVSAEVALLVWGLAAAAGALAMTCLLLVHAMVTRAAVACTEQATVAVERTAILVGDAIAARLSDSEENGAVRLYSQAAALATREQVQYTSGEGSRVPNQPATPNKNFRPPPELWAEVERIADDQGVTNTEIVIRALTAYVRNYPA